jgi:hypothetical protein
MQNAPTATFDPMAIVGNQEACTEVPMMSVIDR